MSKWKVVYTEKAEQDLIGIKRYISLALLEPIIAKNQTNRIMDAADSLEELPFRYMLYDKEPWKSKGLREMPVDNFIVFYLPVESKQTVVIIRIMYGGQDIVAELKNTATE